MNATEEQLRQEHADGNHSVLVTHLLRTEGGAILGFLHSRLGTADAAQEVFARFCEDLWRGINGFEWRCSLRGWAYTLARHAEARYRRDRHRVDRRQLRLDDAPREVLAAVDHVRTTTRLHLRSEVKDRMRALRERLSEEDQTVLVLRVDKGLSWNDLATVIAGAEVDKATLTRESARLRKRFQLIKGRLRDWAREDGLMPE